jgi:hypothetical protein
MTRADIENWFTYDKPDDGQVNLMKHIRDDAKRLAYFIHEFVPECADQSAAIRKLREAVMMANAAIVCERKTKDFDWVEDAMLDIPTHYTDEEGGRWQPINQLPGYRSRPDFPAGWLITKIKNHAFPPWNKIEAFKTNKGYRWDIRNGWGRMAKASDYGPASE